MKAHANKRLLALIMAMVMIFTCLATPAMASPAETTTSEDAGAVERVDGATADGTALVGGTGELNTTEVTIMVSLEGDTVYMQTSDLQLAVAAYDAQMSALAQAETRIEQTLSTSIEVENRYSLLFNGFSFTGEAWMIDAINEMEGVSAFEAPMFELIEPTVTEESELSTNTGKSTSLTGATDAWDLGYTGKGMTIAVIDTGIRQTHEAFSVEPEGGKITKEYLTEVFEQYGNRMHCGTDADAMYYSAKLPFNWDYFPSMISARMLLLPVLWTAVSRSSTPSTLPTTQSMPMLRRLNSSMRPACLQKSAVWLRLTRPI